MAKDKLIEWETIEDIDNIITERSRVPGGWLVRFWGRDISGMTFVPDEHKRWKRKQKFDPRNFYPAGSPSASYHGEEDD